VDLLGILWLEQSQCQSGPEKISRWRGRITGRHRCGNLTARSATRKRSRALLVEANYQKLTVSPDSFQRGFAGLFKVLLKPGCQPLRELRGRRRLEVARDDALQGDPLDAVCALERERQGGFRGRTLDGD